MGKTPEWADLAQERRSSFVAGVKATQFDIFDVRHVVETQIGIDNAGMLRIAPSLTIAACLLACLPFTGCTQYEYVITQPAEFASVLSRQEREITREPVMYFFVDQSSRVGIRIENITDDSLTIKGEESYIVTPAGESSPMRGGTIAPHTWSAITIPALVRVYGGGGGVSFGLGVGTWGSNGGGGIGVGAGGYDPFYDNSFYSPRDEVAWQWKDGTVRMHLVIEKTGDPSTRVEQEFAIDRRKVAK